MVAGLLWATYPPALWLIPVATQHKHIYSTLLGARLPVLDFHRCRADGPHSLGFFGIICGRGDAHRAITLPIR